MTVPHVYAGDVSVIQMLQHIILFGQPEITTRSIIVAAVKLSLQLLHRPVPPARVQHGQWKQMTEAKKKKTGQCVLKYDRFEKKNTKKLIISRENILWSEDNWIFVDRNSKCLKVKERGGNTSYIKVLMAELLSSLDTKRDVTGLATYRDNKTEMRTTWPHALSRSDELLNGTPGELKDMPVENALLAVGIACVE